MHRTVITATTAILTLGSGLGPSRAPAQETVRRVSMEEAVALFERNGLALRIARAEAAEARGTARQSRAYFNPSASLVREVLSGGADDYWETTIGVEQRVEWPGRTVARGRAASRRIDAAEAGFAADSLRLAFRVRRAYVVAWRAEEVETALDRAATTVRRLATAAERRREEGDLSGYDLRRLRVERARMEGALSGARLEAEAARRALATLVLPEADQVGPANALTGRPPPIDRARAIAALEERPDVLAAARSVEAAVAEATAAARGWIPAPTLSAGYKDQADGLSGPVFGLALPLPLFDREMGAARAAEARRVAAEARQELRRREARTDILSALDRYESSRERLATLGDRLVADADELLEIARVAYDEGEMTLVELLDATDAFRAGRISAAELRAETWIAYFDLLRATGHGPEGDR